MTNPKPPIVAASDRATSRPGKYDRVRELAEQTPCDWHRLEPNAGGAPPCRSNRVAHQRAAHIRRGTGAWEPAGRWAARVAYRPDGSGWDVLIRLAQPGTGAAVTS
jgi:hypothetical protein